MVRAYKTRAEMIREAVEELGSATPRDIMDFISRKYPEIEVKENSFRADIIGCSVNHTSSHYYPSMPKFLFYEMENRTYRLYDPRIDGKLVIDDESKEISTEAVISLERDLEEYIIRNLNQIESGLELYTNEGITGRQFNTEVGRIDILALDRNSNFVVIELKAGVANYSVVGQILGYISWVRQNLAEGKEVRGIIIADDFDKKLKYASSEIANILLKRYEVNFTFKDIQNDTNL